MVVYEKWVVTYRELKGQLGLKSAQKTVHGCTVFCAQLCWFTGFDDHSGWLNMDANFHKSEKADAVVGSGSIRMIPAWK